MGSNESVFLVDPGRIRATAKQVCASRSAVKIAVAFWGRGAAKSLALEGRRAESVRIILNAHSGGCNPSELRLLLKRYGKNVRTNAALHAKVFANEDEVLLGSANASANGLGFDGEDEVEGWAEACLHARAPSVCGDAAKWFETIWAESKDLTQEIIEQADDLWHRARRIARARFASNDPIARGAFVVLTHLRREPNALALIAERQRQEPDVDAYQAWTPPCSALILDFVLQDRAVIHNGPWISPKRPEQLDDTSVGRDLRLVRKASKQQVRAACGPKIWHHGPEEDVESVARFLANKNHLAAAKRELAAC